MKLLNRSAITLLAKAPFAAWIASLPADEAHQAEHYTLEMLRKEGNIYLIDEVDEESDFTGALQSSWKRMFENELAAWDEFADNWPTPLSFELFSDWFEVCYQIMAFDMSDDALLVASLDDL